MVRGSPAVWTICLLFFQCGLLLGYTYTHLFARLLKPSRQVIVHLSFLAASLLLLPITPDPGMKPTGGAAPLLGIIKLLLFTVGVPYLLVSTTGPLIQHWYGLSTKGASPYRLYALSNVGSLLGLQTYPFLFEPNLSLDTQTSLWSLGYGLFVVLAGGSAILVYRSPSPRSSASNSREEATTTRSRSIDPPLWILLSACGSILLLSSTNMMTQDVAVIPFLWVLPLALYLISFLIAFDSPRCYHRWFWMPLFLASVPISILLLNQAHGGEELDIRIQVTLYSAALFSAVMVCHGELVRIKPEAKRLTSFYLLVSLGGALGGAFVNLLAPRLFNGF